ncbi:DUF559 domain-containing protein [Bdellovibrionota bacterium FG-2]
MNPITILKAEVKAEFQDSKSSSLTPSKPKALSDKPNFDLNSRALIHHKGHPTPQEYNFLAALLSRLGQTELFGSVSHQEILVIPLSRAKGDPVILKQLVPLYEAHPSIKYSLRVPDFFLEKFGVVIELDGSSHDNCDIRVKRDNTRDAEYLALGLKCFRIENSTIDDCKRGNTQAFHRIVSEIITYLESVVADTNFNKEYQLRRKVLSRARKAIKKAHPSLNIGHFDKKNKKSVSSPSPGHKVAPIQYNGSRHSFRGIASTKKSIPSA